MNQIVLDIDLDYVMGAQCYASNAIDRRDAILDVPISVSKFESFLKTLRLRHGSDGLGFETHTMSAKIWEKLILQGTLKPPFTVIHVDAHHDIYSMPDDVRKPAIHCGNYLVPFLHHGLIDNLVWIAPNGCGDWSDRGWHAPKRLKLISGTRRDLGYQLNKILKRRKYTFTTVAFSPNYCGVMADALIPILMNHLSPSSETLEMMHTLSKAHKYEFDRSKYYFESSSYFRDSEDGMRGTVYIPRLTTRMKQ